MLNIHKSKVEDLLCELIWAFDENEDVVYKVLNTFRKTIKKPVIYLLTEENINKVFAKTPPYKMFLMGMELGIRFEDDLFEEYYFFTKENKEIQFLADVFDDMTIDEQLAFVGWIIDKSDDTMNRAEKKVSKALLEIIHDSAWGEKDNG